MLGKTKLRPGPALENSGPGCRIRFFGPSLALPPPFLPRDAVISIWEKPLLAPAVLDANDDAPEKTDLPQFSFRAAALANLTLRSAGCGEAAYSFIWEIGRLFWLPKPEK
jgi:hypothetical protein